MRDWLKRLIINIICFIAGILVANLIVTKPAVDNGIPDYIDSLNTDSIYRDSIYIVNDSIVEHIIYLEKNYEENVSNILSNSDSTNLCLFTEYIEHYNNQRTTSDN
jgi:hypothetical protein